jgi:hypothetical protein
LPLHILITRSREALSLDLLNILGHFDGKLKPEKPKQEIVVTLFGIQDTAH